MISTLIYMIYFCDKTQRRLPRVFHKLIANTSHAITDRRLNETQTSTGTHLTGECKLQIQQELIAINRQLTELDAEYARLLETYHHSRPAQAQELNVSDAERGSLLAESTSNKNLNTAEKNYLNRIKSGQSGMSSVDALIGMNMLAFLVDFKKFILRHDTNVRKREIELVDVELELEVGQRRMVNFHYIHTLETLKSTILNPAKASARANRRCLRKSRKCPHRQYFSSGDLTQSPSSPERRGARAGESFAGCSSFMEAPRPIKFHRLVAMRTETRNAREFLRTLQSYKAQVKSYLHATCGGDYESEGYIERLVQVPKKEPPPVVVDTATPATAYTIDSQEKLDPGQFEWRYLALVFDRVFFFFFSVLIPVCILVMYAKTVLL
jgi:hypothetical protein